MKTNPDPTPEPPAVEHVHRDAFSEPVKSFFSSPRPFAPNRDIANENERTALLEGAKVLARFFPSPPSNQSDPFAPVYIGQLENEARKLAAKNVELRKALSELLNDHSCVADTSDEDKDGEDHQIESRARALLNDESLPPSNQWREIAFAPKDGTLIDIWEHGKRYVDCQWDKDFEGWKHCYKGVNCVSLSPTYFMIPTPPESKETV